MNPKAIEYLQTLSTRHLLSMLQSARMYGGCLEDWGFGSGVRIVTDDELRHVLGTREHVPNKREGRGLRKLKQDRKQKRVKKFDKRRGRLDLTAREQAEARTYAKRRAKTRWRRRLDRVYGPNWDRTEDPF